MMGWKDNQTRMDGGDVDRLSSLSDDLIHKIFFSYSTKLFVQTSVFSSRWRFIWTSIPCLNLSTQDFKIVAKIPKFVRHVLSRRNSEIEVSSIKLSFGEKVIEGFDFNSLFSECANLTNLTLERCLIEGSEKQFSICHPRLSNLTLENSFTGMMFVNVDAPKLENLTIRNSWISKAYVIKISAPHLTSFVYKGADCHSLRLSTNGFNSLKEADICISSPTDKHPGPILDLFQHLHNIKFLTLNKKFLEHLYSCVVKGTLHQPSVFTNLKRIKIRSQRGSSQSYYLNGTPGATLEEIVAQDLAQILMVDLRVFLDQKKAETKTSMTRMERGKDPMESQGTKMCRKSQAKTNLQIEESVIEKIESCLERLCVQIDQTTSKYGPIISKLQKIDEVFANFSASTMAFIQPSLASYAEAVLFMDGLTDLIKTQSHENVSQISGCIQELATAWKPSYKHILCS